MRPVVIAIAANDPEAIEDCVAAQLPSPSPLPSDLIAWFERASFPS